MSLRSPLLGLGLALVALVLVAGSVVTWIGAAPFDDDVVRAARDLRDDRTGALMRWASEVGYVRILGPIAGLIACVAGGLLHRWRSALLVPTATIVTSLLNRLLKELFDRARPADGVEILAAGFSMPSGHAAVSSAFVTSIILAVPSVRARLWLVPVAVAFAGVVGASRVILGVHYPTDVVAGWCLGAGIALVTRDLLNRPDHHRTSRAR